MDMEEDFYQEEEHTRVSRSQRKREAQEITELGKQLILMAPKKLNTLPIEPMLLKEVLAAQSMRMGALKRQILYIAKLMRSMDLEPLHQALKKLK